MNAKLDVVRLTNEDVIATSGICSYKDLENVMHIRFSTKSADQPSNYIYAETWIISDGEVEIDAGDYPKSDYDGHGVTICEGNVYHTVDGETYYECHADHSYLDSLSD